MVSENIGISTERSDEFFNAAKSVCVAALFTDSEITRTSQAIELFLNKVQPTNLIEAFWAGFVLSEVFSQSEAMAEKMEHVGTS